MRVTYVSASGEIGGAERVLLDCAGASSVAARSLIALGAGRLLDAARAQGFDVRALEVPGPIGSAGDAFGAGAVVRDVLPILKELPGFLDRFSQALAAFDPDVVHTHGIKPHVLAAMSPGRAAVVWHLHDYAGARSVSSRLLRLLAHRCDLAIAVSESVAKDARAVLPASLPIVVVRNAVDTDRFTPAGAALDLDAAAALPSADPSTVRIGLPATFARWKGHEVFLQAMARLRRGNVRAYVIGGALYQTRNSQWRLDELREQAARLGLSEQVGFTGVIADMPAAYRALDIVVHASTRPEPFGLVIAEAMACGRALVASPEGGAGELFDDGVDALAARGGDAAALASAIERLVAAPQLRESLGRAARQRALASFTQERFGRELNAALTACANPAGASERSEGAHGTV
jgi:glycosyltransferase involved in cell wall biosynthesis